MRTISYAFLMAGLLCPAALADWDLTDPHKMHYPQLPDPNGWDVKANYSKVLADDWTCSASGPVEDFHIWGSWYNDEVGIIRWIEVSIFSDIPDPDGTGPLYSMPGDLLWNRVFYSIEDIQNRTPVFTLRPWGTGNQGWYDPNLGLYLPNNHVNTHQINFEDFVDPFIQVEGTTYWLAVTVESNYGEWGWKTSMSPHWKDDAVWCDYVPDGHTPWQELRDPAGVSLDLAFVITPEPITLALFVLGALALPRRRRV